MTFSNSIQLKMIKISTVSRTQEVTKIKFFKLGFKCFSVNSKFLGVIYELHFTMPWVYEKLVAKKVTSHKKIKFSIKDFFTQENVNLIIFTKTYSIENFIFVCNGLNNLFLTCFQNHYDFIYRVDDIILAQLKFAS